MDKELQLDMAIVYYACPICAEKVDDELIMDRRLKRTTPLHDECHHKCVGISPKLCEKCLAALAPFNGDAAFLIEVRKPVTDDDKKNPYKTGHVVGMHRQWFDRMSIPLPENQWMYVEEPMVQMIMEAQKELDT